MNNAGLNADSNALFAWPKKHLRLVVRCTSLIAAVICLSMILAGDSLIRYVAAVSPFVAIASLLTTKTLQPIMALGFTAALIALLRRRWFCRWACPMGLCLDGASYAGRRLKRKPSHGAKIGQWLALLTLGGAVLGYPLFLWLDPLALFSGLFLLTETTAIHLAWISLLPLLVLLVLSGLWPDIWCHRLCPLGALQDMTFVLPGHAQSILSPRTTKPLESDTAQKMARRTVLALAVGAGCAGASRQITRKPTQPLRPPGAVEELTFAGLCTRCGNCIRACPYHVIQRDAGTQGWAGILAPALSFENDYCREGCTRCTQVCPSGALAYVSHKQKPNIRIGLPRVDMDICLLAEDRECSACMRWCPYEAIRYVFSDATYSLTPAIDPDKCNGCGACQTACPTKPVKAIRVFPPS